MIFLGGVLLRTGYSLFSGLAWLNSFVFTGRIYCRALNGAESSHTHTLGAGSFNEGQSFEATSHKLEGGRGGGQGLD